MVNLVGGSTGGVGQQRPKAGRQLARPAVVSFDEADGLIHYVHHSLSSFEPPCNNRNQYIMPSRSHQSFVLILLPIIAAFRTFPPTGEGTCYNIDGSTEATVSACYSLDSVGASMCCHRSDLCNQDGLCITVPRGLIGTYDEGRSIWRRSCSDYTWQDPACLAMAPWVLANGVQLSRCVDGTWCPRNEADVNTTCCSEHQGQYARDSGAPIAAALVNSIRHPQTTLRQGTATTIDDENARSTSDNIRSSSTRQTRPAPTETNTSTSPPNSQVTSALHPTSPTTSQFTSALRPTSPPNSQNTSSVSGAGLSTSDKIALGIGIGIGLPTLITGIVTCWKMSWRKSHDKL